MDQPLDRTSRDSWHGYSMSAPGEIQPFACLLCFTRDFRCLLLASANAGDILGIDVGTVMGKPAHVLGNEAFFAELDAALSQASGEPSRVVRQMAWARDGGATQVHVVAWLADDERVVVEFEQIPPLPEAPVLAQINHWLGKLSAVEESESLFDTLAQAVHEFTGFERALVYELDGDGCATIVSESADMGLPSVLGGKIPGHEFPPDLERLYELNPTRFIADTHISPVPLNASNHPLSRRPLDLRIGKLRAVAPFHLGTLRRNGVRTAMYVAIRGMRGLRGFVICHSAQPIALSPLIRGAFWNFVQMASQRLAFIESRAHIRFERQLLESRNLITEQHRGIKQPAALVERYGDQWLELLACSGTALLLDRKATILGVTPDRETLFAIKRRLVARESLEDTWYSDNLAESVLADLDQLEGVGGLLAVRLPSASPAGWLMLFRPEEPRISRWVTDPKQGGEGPSALALQSRGPAPLFHTEVRHGCSQPWLQETARAAEDLAEDLTVAISAQRIAHLVDELKHQRNHYAGLATLDGLTKIANRYHTEQLLRSEIEAAQRFGRPCALVLMDVDHFKTFNDQHGHNGGDQVLKALATRVSGMLRESDHFGRWGGEEFVIVVSNSTLVEAAGLAERVRRAVADMTLAGLPAITLSLGVAQWRHGEDHRALVRRADSALYQAKAAGRNQVVLSDPGISTSDGE